MIEFLLLINAFFLGYYCCKKQIHEVKVKIKVDANEAIVDLKRAEEAIKELKKEMNL